MISEIPLGMVIKEIIAIIKDTPISNPTMPDNNITVPMIILNFFSKLLTFS